MDDRFERVATVPGCELVRRRSAEGVLHAVNVHAAGTEARCWTRGPAGRMAAHNDISAVKYVGFVHHRFWIGRHHLFARRAIDDHASGLPAFAQVLGHSNGSGHAHRTLRAVLIAVEGPLSA